MATASRCLTIRRISVLLLLIAEPRVQAASDGADVSDFMDNVVDNVVEHLLGWAYRASPHHDLDSMTFGRPAGFASSNRASFVTPFRRSASLLHSTASLVTPYAVSSSVPRRPARQTVVRAEESIQDLEATEENIRKVLESEEVLDELKVFDTPLHLELGFNGRIEFVEMDGPRVVIALYGKFEDERKTVLQRVNQLLRAVFPEIDGVDVEDPEMLDESNNVFSDETEDSKYSEDEGFLPYRPIGDVSQIPVAADSIGEEEGILGGSKGSGKYDIT